MKFFVADIGNTLVKYSVFTGFSEQEVLELSYDEFKNEFAKIISSNFISKGLICTVKNLDAELTKDILKFPQISIFNHTTKIPLKNLYKTPETLGTDRLAGAVGANSLFPNQNCLLIDCGTCIKYDFVNSKNEYLGGSISPGIKMRFEALHTFTDKLPLLEIENTKNNFMLTGNSTESAIFSGVMNGILAEVEGIIQRYKIQFEDIKILISGGDYEFFAKNLKNNIFARRNLVLLGLSVILKHHDEIH